MDTRSGTTEPAGGAPDHTPHRLEQQRRENRDAIAALGVDPYGNRTDDLVSLADARRIYDPQADTEHQAAARAAKENPAAAAETIDRRPVVRIAGRVVLKREGGKLIWLQVRDHTTGPMTLFDTATDPTHPEAGRGPSAALMPDLQIAVSLADVAAPGFEVAKNLDLGDVIVAEGPVMRTRTGEITVWARALSLGAKCLTPPPEKWAGLTDVEARYRRRYIDLWANPEALWTLQMRSRLIHCIRSYLDARGFVEVETPVLQLQAGGAAARPFITHMNALSVDLYLRIAPELFLKRLLVGGMPRVYEISRNFRNEGVDRSHNPEFTSLEVYQAFGNSQTMMEITEGLIRACAWMVATGSERGVHGLRPVKGESAGELTLPFGDLRIDYGSPFIRISYAELFHQALGFPITDHDRAVREAAARGLKTRNDKGEALDPVWIVNELFEEVAEKRIDPQRPTFVTDYPAALSPLTRPRKDDPTTAERWDIFIGGMEVGPAYTELNDPDVQAAKFREQLAGIDADETTFRTFDADFVEALKVGMPPAGGMGMGIDRICMLLLNQVSIRDVIAFPMMRPEA
jgi:lysyl-tRNA synthetase class 2